MGFFDYFRNNAETRENHDDPELRSHYYKTNYKTCKEVIHRYLHSMNLEPTSVNDQFGEILVRTNKFYMVITIISVTPIETAIDFKVNTYRVVAANKPKEIIKNGYVYLDKSLPYKGVGLNP